MSDKCDLRSRSACGEAGRLRATYCRFVLTIGHGTASQEDFTALLGEATIERIVDVRRFPGSRKHPQFNREAMAKWLPEHRIDYRWDERLGGRRRPEADSPDTWWRVEAFRGYAGHMRTGEFLEALDELMTRSDDKTTAIICSESLWWRCHRRMIADFAVLARGTTVSHLLHNGSTTTHPLAEGARLAEGLLIYDGDQIS